MIAQKWKVMGFKIVGPAIWAKLECGHHVIATDVRGCAAESITDAEQQIGDQKYCFYCTGDPTA